MRKINVFNGYYEVFICKGFLKNPYSFRFSGTAEEIEDFYPILTIMFLLKTAWILLETALLKMLMDCRF